MSAAAVKSPTLASSLWPASGLARQLVLAVAGAALLTLSAKVSVPFFPVPMTLQTLVVLLIGAAYGWRLGAATVLLYLAQGAIGLPVFTNTPPLVAGPAYFFGPTGGFLAGFVVAAAIVGFAAERGLDRSPLRFLGVLIAADAVLLALGCAWLAFFAVLPNGPLGLERAFAAGVAPFLLGEALKVAIVAALVPAAWRALANFRG